MLQDGGERRQRKVEGGGGLVGNRGGGGGRRGEVEGEGETSHHINFMTSNEIRILSDVHVRFQPDTLSYIALLEMTCSHRQYCHTAKLSTSNQWSTCVWRLVTSLTWGLRLRVWDGYFEHLHKWMQDSIHITFVIIITVLHQEGKY